MLGKGSARLRSDGPESSRANDSTIEDGRMTNGNLVQHRRLKVAARPGGRTRGASSAKLGERGIGAPTL